MWQSPPKIETEVMTPIGLCHCGVYATKWADQYEVEFWQFEQDRHRNNLYTKFCGSRHFQKTGDRYTIIRRKPTDYANELWLELERIGSNLILLNT